MYQQLSLINPITEEVINWDIEIINLNYNEWQNKQYEMLSSTNPSTGDKISYLLDSLNPRFYKGEIYFGTDSSTYKRQLSEYFKVLYTINNCFLYNHYIELLIDRIQQNIKFEYWANMKEFTHKVSKIKSEKSSTVQRVRIKNEWVKHETKDMFTGKTTYLYENLRTGETQESEDPNLLLELNATKKKKKPIIKIELNFK